MEKGSGSKCDWYIGMDPICNGSCPSDYTQESDVTKCGDAGGLPCLPLLGTKVCCCKNDSIKYLY